MSKPERLELLEALSECAQNKADMKAEIERLKEENKITVSVCNENTDLKKLITELCDALDRYTPDAEGGYREAKELIQRAREATQ